MLSYANQLWSMQSYNNKCTFFMICSGATIAGWWNSLGAELFHKSSPSQHVMLQTNMSRQLKQTSRERIGDLYPSWTLTWRPRWLLWSCSCLPAAPWWPYERPPPAPAPAATPSACRSDQSPCYSSPEQRKQTQWNSASQHTAITIILTGW